MYVLEADELNRGRFFLGERSLKVHNLNVLDLKGLPVDIAHGAFLENEAKKIGLRKEESSFQVVKTPPRNVGVVTHLPFLFLKFIIIEWLIAEAEV